MYFFIGYFEAGFHVAKNKFEEVSKVALGSSIGEFKPAKLSDGSDGYFMMCDNVTNFENMGALICKSKMMQWNKDDGAVYIGYRLLRWKFINLLDDQPSHNKKLQRSPSLTEPYPKRNRLVKIVC